MLLVNGAPYPTLVIFLGGVVSVGGACGTCGACGAALLAAAATADAARFPLAAAVTAYQPLRATATVAPACSRTMPLLLRLHRTAAVAAAAATAAAILALDTGVYEVCVLLSVMAAGFYCIKRQNNHVIHAPSLCIHACVPLPSPAVTIAVGDISDGSSTTSRIGR